MRTLYLEKKTTLAISTKKTFLIGCFSMKKITFAHTHIFILHFVTISAGQKVTVVLWSMCPFKYHDVSESLNQVCFTGIQSCIVAVVFYYFDYEINCLVMHRCWLSFISC